MKQTRQKTYLSIPVFLSMVFLTGQVSADEVTVSSSESARALISESTVGQTVTAATENVPAQGTYTFTEKTGIKGEPKQSSPDLDVYYPGERVHYDKTVESDDRLWISYDNYIGSRSYVAARDLPDHQSSVTDPGQPVTASGVPVASASSTDLSPIHFPATGTYTFTEKTGVKSEPKQSAVDRDYYYPGEQVNYDKTLERDDHLWLSYLNFSGGRSYVAVKNLKPVPPAPVSVPVTQPVAPPPPSASSNFPSTGTYTLTEKTGVKSEPKQSAVDRDYYYPGEQVNYDKTLERDDQLWLSYVNFSGGRSYVAVKQLATKLTEEVPDLKEAKRHNAQVKVTNYDENKTSFTVEVIGQEDTKKITQVRVAVWSADQGQDDVQWYEPAVEGNKAVAKISIANHSNTSDNYQVQVYTTYSDHQTVASSVESYKIVKPSLAEIYGTEVVNTAKDSIKTVLQVASDLLGIRGGDAAHKKIVDDYNSVQPLPVGYKVTYEDDWCDIFMTVVFQRAGLSHLIGRECGVERHIGIFQNLGIWNEDGTITPKTGDLITFNWNQNRQANNGFADHIAIVTHVDNGLIHTIEGNKDNEVKRYSYKIGDGNIRGFVHPLYS